MFRWAKVAVVLLPLTTPVEGCVSAPDVLPPQAIPREAGAAEPAWAGRGPGELYPVGVVRVWVMRQGGHEIGRSYGRYQGPDPGRSEHHVFETRIELNIPGRPEIRSEGRVVVDANGHLVEGVERSNAAEIRIERRGSFLRLETAGGSDEVTYEPERVETAFWADTAILHEELMLGLRPLSVGELAWRLVSISGGVPVEWEANVTVSADGVVWLQTNLGEEIQFREGRIQAVRVKADDLEVVEEHDQGWPAWSIDGPRQLTYAMPTDGSFTIREVDLPGKPEQGKLAGEVLIPRGTGPFAVAVFLSGSGRQDRYGFAGPPPVDVGSHFITDALAQRGFLVLRYDEPGFGKSDAVEVSFASQIEDARRALATALVQPEADPDRIVLVGHGEGGWRALMLAGVDAHIRGVALLGTPGRPYREVLLHQTEATLEGLPPEVRNQARETSRLMLEEIEGGTEVPPELRAQATWLRQVLKVDVPGLFRGIKARVLIAQGDADFEVDPVRDFDGLKRAAKSARVKSDSRRYPQLDHLFMIEAETSSPARYLVPNRTMGKTFLQELGDWAVRTVDSRPRRK